jgi:hypothetical protein
MWEYLQACPPPRTDAQPKVGFLARMPLPHQIAQAYASYPPTEERILKVQMEISTLLPGRDDYIFDTSEFQEVRITPGASEPANPSALRRWRCLT